MKTGKHVTLSVAEARRLLMGGAGLLSDPAEAPAALKIVRSLGLLQVDSINVVERAHELILHARSDAYRPGQIFDELRRKKLFEHWTHDASLLPVEWYPYWRHRFERSKSKGWHLRMLGPEAQKIIDAVLERVRVDGKRGGLMSRDFEAPGHTTGGWWNWKPAKAALEYLWRTGQLAVRDRKNFQKVYDLSERIIPARHFDAPLPSREETTEWACSEALERLGLATPKELADFFAWCTIAEARAWADAGLRSGRLVPVEVEGRVSVAFADVKRRVKRLGDPPPHARLLAPFDPIVRDRNRAERLFGFQYRFEAFVPEAKRVHGYYVLPVLKGDQFVARVSPKFDRDKGVLRAKVVSWEVRASKELKREVEAAAARLGQFVGAERVEVR